MNDRLTELVDTLPAFACGDLSVQDLARHWRDAAEQHEPALPERYVEVLERLLNQLESAALFTEESCSFSQSCRAAALQDWLRRALTLQER